MRISTKKSTAPQQRIVETTISRVCKFLTFFKIHVYYILSYFYKFNTHHQFKIPHVLFLQPLTHITFFQRFHQNSPNYFRENHQQQQRSYSEFMFVIAPNYCVKSFPYDNVISLNNAFLFYDKFLLPLTTMLQMFSYIYFYHASTSIYWFTTLYPM